MKGVTEGQHINVVRVDDGAAEPCFFIPDALKDKGYTKGIPDIAFNAAVCDESVISVGATVNRLDWTNYAGENVTFSTTKSKVTGKPQEVGEIVDFSSFGLDDNGLAIPTIVAPGAYLLSAFNTYDKTNFDGGNVTEAAADYPALVKCVERNGRKNWFAYDQGTSMSCPHAAGIVALWMQADPTLTTKKIREILKETSIKDAFVTDVTKIPSGNIIQAGYGKIDALEGLKKIKGTTAIESVYGDGTRQTTPSTMYSVEAPVYNMMGQRVDKNTRGLVVYKGKKYVNR